MSLNARTPKPTGTLTDFYLKKLNFVVWTRQEFLNLVFSTAKLIYFYELYNVILAMSMSVYREKKINLYECEYQNHFLLDVLGKYFIPRLSKIWRNIGERGPV